VFVHAPIVRLEAEWLWIRGFRDAEVAHRLGLPRTTVRDWRRSTPTKALRCPRCWRRTRPMAFAGGDYAELLGLYLGDGCISNAGRTQRLRLSLDAKYPVIANGAGALLARCLPSNIVSASSADGGSTVVVSVYSTHLTCLFPQAGRGKKHERTIRLERWQRSVIDAFPWSFIRGCIRSDGCAFVNRTGTYSYLSYDFYNLSRDIREHFMRACEVAGVEYRAHAERVRINRRASVALMQTHVGLKR
jgi:hypothetical protein